MSKAEITIKTFKFDGTPHRSWKAGLIERDGNLLVFKGVFDKEVVHDKLGTIHKGTISYEYYWLDRWYNVFRFHEPDGTFRNFYCNINRPPVFENDMLEYVDLDIDIYVDKDFSLEVWDEDEFEENLAKYGYPDEMIEKTRSTLKELKTMIVNREFPFVWNPTD